eukprot:COSAG02_NODE_15252_length_1189_cov_2.834627_1_plen_80_part_10
MSQILNSSWVEGRHGPRGASQPTSQPDSWLASTAAADAPPTPIDGECFWKYSFAAMIWLVGLFTRQSTAAALELRVAGGQ